MLEYKEADLPGKYANAYWSLTLLSKPDYCVVPNMLGRYNMNNVSKLENDEDGSLKIYLAPELPSRAPEANWLPTPKGKSFSLNHRFSVPKEYAISYQLYIPPIEKIKG